MSRALEEWERDAPVKVGRHSNGAHYVPYAPLADSLYRELWHLADYRVDGVSGGSVWPAPREATNDASVQ